MREQGGAVRFYRTLLRIYPQAHRRDYGTAMVQLFGDRWRDEQPNRSPLAWIAFWGGMIGDVASSALTERMEGSMSKVKVNRQNWWVWLAGLVGVWEAMMGIGFGVDPESTTGDRILGAVVGVAFLVVFAGLWLRRERLRLGNTLIVVGVIPALLAGPAFLWFPPMWLSTIAAAVVMAKAAQEVVAARSRRPRDAPAV